ncbi:MAG: TraX protein [Oscillospiraceae bacterium]|nr:TraX protein [Oscillospiraceae bacterium]
MKHKGLTQEGLKLIACVTMLIDHIGAALVPWMWLRVMGRLSFPIYCFLLAEGMARTRDVKRYGIRLAIGAVLSEVPFDLLFFGRLTLVHQSVMVTLLLGYAMVLWLQKMPRMPLIPLVVCALAAELLGTDYGAMGVAMIALFALTRGREGMPVQILGLAAVCWMIGGAGWRIGPVFVPAQIVGVLAMVPIGLYNGKKFTVSRAVQWGFYLFYPVHLLVLLVISMM